MKIHLNKIYTGVIAGLIIPLITLLIFNQVAFDQFSVGEFIQYMVNRGKLSSVLSLVILPDLFALLVLISKFLI